MTGKPKNHGFNDEQRTKVLDALRTGKNISIACAEAGVSDRQVRKYRAHDNDLFDPEFAAEFDEAYDEGAGFLIEVARCRAVEGVTEPLVSNGKLVRDDSGEIVTVQKYDHRLLELLIKQRDPSFRDGNTRIELTGHGGGPVVVQHEKRLTLADVVGLAGTLDRPVDSPRGQLSAAAQVLAEPEPSQPATSTVPARPQP